MEEPRSVTDPLLLAERLAKPVSIPPRPALLIALQHEIAKDDPHLRKIASLIQRDAGISGNLLAIANSAVFNLRQHVNSVEDAITLIGLNTCAAIITRLLARRALGNGKQMMPRFWDVSEKRSRGMMFVAQSTRATSPHLAYHFGLFSDIGIPVLMASFPDYVDTLALANQIEKAGFLEIEDNRHRINHALVGAKLADHWGTDSHVVQAIRQHHAHQILSDADCAQQVRNLIALFFLVDRAIQEYRHASSVEWQEGGEAAISTLGLQENDADDLCEEIKRQFLQPAVG
ncbi:HDOD domain-containing protein [uncultured Oxalicibacterium sp.]|uniref:HDOD domain-containing protein n=1 Tax=uncultured Oxalicibacterium sp. TaxID=1168540 RepID=UPI0025D9553B|nr:HDOD domain-containing protein [uncultured Oxalicibacterium sp.]